MRVLIMGSLAGPLAEAARMATASGARIEHLDHASQLLARLRGAPDVNLLLVELSHDIGALRRALDAERMTIPLVACAVSPRPEQAAEAIRQGAREFLPLPPDPELIAALLRAVATDSHAVVASDPSMLATLRRADQVARSDASVLIVGESGTGKEVLARHIHRRSRRAAGPFVALNCAAIPEHLLESELFGHEKGAFSGAIARRLGKFEAAEGGTLLLDEISEMDMRLQSKLLRAIQEREIDRLGGAAPVKVNVRLLATSNRDLPAEVAAGNFRQDLYFRLNVVTVRLPPLRERPCDIPVLAEHYARHYAAVNGMPPRPLSPAALAKLTAYAWPGNVRELENVIHRSVLLATGTPIEPSDIELPEPRPAVARCLGESAGMVAGFVGRRMEDVERDLILQTLSHTLGNRTHAATMLGISIRALRNKLRDYASAGIAVPPPAAGLPA